MRILKYKIFLFHVLSIFIINTIYCVEQQIHSKNNNSTQITNSILDSFLNLSNLNLTDYIPNIIPILPTFSNWTQYKKKLKLSNDLVKIILKVFYSFAKITNNSIFYDHVLGDQPCIDSLMLLLSTDEKGKLTLDNILNNSGKNILDIGSEDDCVTSYNLTYLFITYTLNNTYSFTDPAFTNMFNFLNQKTFFTGVCVWRECNNFYKAFFDKSQNQVFFDSIRESLGILNLTLFKMNYAEKDESNNNIKSINKFDFWDEPKMKILLICLWIFVIYFFFRLITTFIGYVLFELNSESDDNYNEDGNNISIDFSMSDQLGYSDLKFNETNKINFLKGRKQKENKREGLLYRIFRICSMKRSVEILFKKKTKYYNEDKLEILGGFRFYTFIFLTFLQNICGIITLPHRDSTGYTFFSSIWFFFVKYSSNIVHCFAALNGIYLGFKLMNYIKKNNNQFTFKNLLIFYFKSLPPFIFFLISFLLSHSYVTELGYLLRKLTIFDYFVETNINEKYCIINPETVFYPFYLQYSMGGPDNNLSNCFRWLYFVSSEFYCFTFFLFLIYILLKIKNRKLDIFIYILSWANFILCYFSYTHDLKTNNYTINDAFGEIKTFMYPHLFFIPYFLGINVGIMYYYYYDVTSDRPVSEDDKYHLFFFNYYLMKYFDKKSEFLKKSLIIITNVLQVLMCLHFYFFLYLSMDNNSNNIIIEGNFLIDFIFIYEGKIFTILFLLFVSSVIIYPKDTSLKKILSSEIFIYLNRISFTFYISHDFIIVIFYSLYNIQIYLNFQNTFFMTLTLLVIIIVFSIVSIILYELPLRMISRNLIDYFIIKKNRKNKIKYLD